MIDFDEVLDSNVGKVKRMKDIPHSYSNCARCAFNESAEDCAGEHNVRGPRGADCTQNDYHFELVPKE